MDRSNRRSNYRVLNADNTNLQLDQYKLPRPCYYLLRLFGLWQPGISQNIAVRLYNYFTSLIWLALLCNIYVIIIISISKKNGVGAIINNFMSSLNLSCPYLYSRFYFHKKSYEDVLTKIIGTNRELLNRLTYWSRIYSLISICLWIIFYIYFYRHWILYIDYDYLPIFVTSMAILTGYWSCWLSIYAFHCHALKIKVNRYCENIRESLGKSLRRKEVIPISYSKNEFGVEFGIDLFILGLVCDVASIFIKLLPAAFVCQALHEIVITAGEHCNVDLDAVELPKERFYFYKFLSMSDEDLGVYVLGVKITSKFTVGLFATVMTAGLTLIYYAMPFIKKIPV